MPRVDFGASIDLASYKLLAGYMILELAAVVDIVADTLELEVQELHMFELDFDFVVDNREFDYCCYYYCCCYYKELAMRLEVIYC